jgi:hypothetical protein
MTKPSPAITLYTASKWTNTNMETKYNVHIYRKDKPARISKEIQENLKGVVSAKKIREMKLEFVDCPVLKREAPFLECFVCPNHIRRFKGDVHCAGNPLPQ